MQFTTPRALARLTPGLAAFALGLLAAPSQAQTETGNGAAETPLQVRIASAGEFNALPAARAGQDIDRPDFIPRRYPLALRLGATLSPRVRFVGGGDITFPTLSIGQGFVSRLDAEVIVAANFGGVSALVPVTFNQVYSRGLVEGARRVYGGIGFGPYIGEVTRLGGKFFIGTDITSRYGAEFTVHFPGFGGPMTALQLRYNL